MSRFISLRIDTDRTWRFALDVTDAVVRWVSSQGVDRRRRVQDEDSAVVDFRLASVGSFAAGRMLQIRDTEHDFALYTGVIERVEQVAIGTGRAVVAGVTRFLHGAARGAKAGTSVHDAVSDILEARAQELLGPDAIEVGGELLYYAFCGDAFALVGQSVVGPPAVRAEYMESQRLLGILDSPEMPGGDRREGSVRAGIEVLMQLERGWFHVDGSGRFRFRNRDHEFLQQAGTVRPSGVIGYSRDISRTRASVVRGRRYVGTVVDDLELWMARRWQYGVGERVERILLRNNGYPVILDGSISLRVDDLDGGEIAVTGAGDALTVVSRGDEGHSAKGITVTGRGSVVEGVAVEDLHSGIRGGLVVELSRIHGDGLELSGMLILAADEEERVVEALTDIETYGSFDGSYGLLESIEIEGVGAGTYLILGIEHEANFGRVHTVLTLLPIGDYSFAYCGVDGLQNVGEVEVGL